MRTDGNYWMRWKDQVGSRTDPLVLTLIETTLRTLADDRVMTVWWTMWWPFDDRVITVWWPIDDCLMTAWRSCLCNSTNKEIEIEIEFLECYLWSPLLSVSRAFEIDHPDNLANNIRTAAPGHHNKLVSEVGSDRTVRSRDTNPPGRNTGLVNLLQEQNDAVWQWFWFWGFISERR